MKLSNSAATTILLEAIRAGDAQARDRLFAHVYDELLRMARAVRRDRGNLTLNTTALVHEAYLKLVGSDHLSAQNRLHFMRIAARAMRQVLVNAAERRHAAKRGAGQFNVTLHYDRHAAPLDAAHLLALNEALSRLEALDPRQVQIVECRFFTGLTIDETAEALDLSAATVNREWRLARAWLQRELNTP